MATEIPEPTDGGLKYTFTIKDGVKFGPPVNREVTSKDFKYAIERIGKPGLGLYANYYTPHQGLPGVPGGQGQERLGHHHARRQDDRLRATASRPATSSTASRCRPTAPIPEEVAKCHTQAGEYGRYVISTGPYMLEGADKLDISSCASQKPISGFNPNTGFKIVRNPNYDPATDDTGDPRVEPRPLRDRRQHQPRQHLRQDRARRARGLASRRRTAPPCASTSRTRIDPRAPAGQRSATASGTCT